MFKPEYAGGIVEVARALYLSKKKINYDTLLEYAKKFDSQAFTAPKPASIPKKLE